MTEGSKARERMVLALFLLSGSAALIYEVAWTRALTLVLGSTTYALSTLLATFMAGLALGAFIGGRLADRVRSQLSLLGFCEIGIGLAGLVSVPLIYALPRAYLWIYQAAHLYPGLFFLLQVLLCAAVMLLPTTLMGATFPLVSRVITTRLDQVGRQVGSAYSFNTMGAIIGSIAAGFALIPLFGIHGATIAAALINLIAGGAFLLLGGRRGLRLWPLALFVALPVAALTSADRADAFNISFYNMNRFAGAQSYQAIAMQQRERLTLLSEEHDVAGTVRALRTARGHLVLQVGGKIEGTGAKDLDNTRLLALLPIASHPAPRSMLVIGLGAGVTLAAAKPHLDAVEVVEINPAVIRAVERFGPPGVLDDVSLVIDDARGHLLKRDRRYDLISSEPSYPTEAVVANLFTREFFELAATRLTDEGVYCQWLPYHMLTNADVTMMLKTFGSVFPHTMLWRVPAGLDLLLVGRKQPFGRDAEQIRQQVAALSAPDAMPEFSLSRTPAEIAEIVRRPDVSMHTDDRPRLEFRAAQNLLLGELALREREEATRGQD